MILHGDDTYRYENIRLNFSSNVYNHFDHAPLFAHLAERMACIKSYPPPEPQELEAMIASQSGIAPDNVMVTNGATEAIYLIAQAYRGARSRIIQPTFSEYEQACLINGHTITDDNPDLIWLCNPNNPTGQVTPEETFFNLSTEGGQRSLLIIDHSYAKFTEHISYLTPQSPSPSPLGGPEGSFTLHSMTKEYAIPGLRLGYVTADATLLRRLRSIHMPWSVNALAVEAGKFILQHQDHYSFDVHALMLERQRVAEALTATGYIDVMPSDTHILLCRLHHGTAARLKEHLVTRHGILIRDASNFRGLTPAHFRIAVQTPQENDELINILKLYSVSLRTKLKAAKLLL